MDRVQHMKLVRRAPPRSSSEADGGLTVPVGGDGEDTTTSRRRASRTSASARTTTTTSSTTSQARNTTPASSSSTIATSALITPQSSSGSSSAASQSNVSAAASTNETSSHTPMIGAVVGAVAGVLFLAAIIFFFVRRRQRRQNTTDAGYRKNEKDDDERSFIGGNSQQANESTFMNEKSTYGAFPPQQGFGMENMQQQQQQGNPWEHGNSQLSYAHTPPGNGGHHSYDSIDGMGQNPNEYNQYPPTKAPTNGFMSPPASSVGPNNITPYGAALPQKQQMPPPIIIQSDAEGPFADPQWANKLFKVTRTFQPNMPDELVIKTGDRVKILMAYDDGWCLGENIDSVPTPSQGVFPKDCVEEIGLNDVAIPTANSFNSADGPESPSKLARAPTLPPIDVSNETYRDSHIADSYFGAAENNSSPTKKHTSAGSMQSLNHRSSMIDHFPRPNGLDAQAQKPVKRASSLIASKDANLFMALGAAMNTDKA